MLHNDTLLSIPDPKQQQISFPSLSTYMSDIIVDDQSSKQLSKFDDESEDTKSPLFQDTSELVPYGVDWSDRAESTSHCWLPYSSRNSSASRLCAYITCKNGKSTSDLALVQCPTCLLIMHAAHLSELQEAITNTHRAIAPCRPSFMDNNTADDIGMHDQHYWSHVPALSLPCTHCKQKSLKGVSSYNNNKRAPIKVTLDDGAVSESATTCIAENVNPKLNEPSSGLMCMWCSRRYHRRCWESIKDDGDNNRCDYGQCGDMVVRPQWLRRIADVSFQFHAQMPDNLETNHTSPTPVIFFINKLSGGQKGQQIYRMLVRLLNPRQVFLLENDSTITEALNIYSSLANLRICICGGDGTVGWVLSRLVDAFPALKNPPTSIYPLGTGNDLSRVLGWGYRYTSTGLLRTLMQITRANPIALDRWKIQIETLEENATGKKPVETHRRFFSFMHDPKFIRHAEQPLYENHRTPINTFFFNYISFGLDAAVVLDYHARRTRDPSKYTSPSKNKILCIKESRKYLKEFAFGIAWNLSSYMRLICDGQDLTDSIRHCHSLVLLNTRSFGSGTHPWGRGRTSTNRIASQSTDRWNNESYDQISIHSPQAHDSRANMPDGNRTTTATANVVAGSTVNNFETQDFGDHKIEVFGLTTSQMALIHMGFHGNRIAQCNQVRIELSHPMPVHMDGEAFYLPESIAVNITHAGQVIVLRNENR